MDIPGGYLYVPAEPRSIASGAEFITARPNRPFVCTPKGVRLCRPSEVVLELMDTVPPGPFAKKDGTLVVDAEGQRIA
jgi:hypothetical protein